MMTFLESKFIFSYIFLCHCKHILKPTRMTEKQTDKSYRTVQKIQASVKECNEHLSVKHYYIKLLY